MWSLALEDAEGAVVVGLMGDFVDQVGVYHIAVGVEYDDGAGEQAGERAVDELEAVFVCELRRTEGRGGHYIVDALGGAEAAQGEGQIHRYAYDSHIGYVGSHLVEAAHAHGAHRGVEAREYIEHDALAAEIAAGYVGEVFGHEIEAGCFGAYGGDVAIGVAGSAFEMYGFHIREM